MSNLPNFTAVILAGGSAERMQDHSLHGLKTLLPINGISMLERICQNLNNAKHRPINIALNIFPDQQEFAPDMPLALDQGNQRQGPLAGIAAGLDWTIKNHPDIQWVLTLCGDTPFIPNDLAESLLRRALENNTSVACAASLGRTHPPIAIWSTELYEPITHALQQNMRKIDRFTQPFNPAVVEWNDVNKTNIDVFFNINKMKDIDIANKKQY